METTNHDANNRLAAGSLPAEPRTCECLHSVRSTGVALGILGNRDHGDPCETHLVPQVARAVAT